MPHPTWRSIPSVCPYTFSTKVLHLPKTALYFLRSPGSGKTLLGIEVTKMLCADRRIKPGEVKVITGYPRTEILMEKIRQAGFENSQLSVLNHSDHTRVELQKAFKDAKVRVILADECVIPGDVTLEEGSQQDWRWLDSISNSSTDLVLCLKPSPAAEKVKLPMATRVTTKFLPTPHRQGLQPNCMWRYYSRVKGLDNHLDVK